MAITDWPLDDRPREKLGVAPMIVMAPVNLLASAASSKWPGRKAALAKPVKRNDLFWCIAEVLRGPVPNAAAARPPAPRGPGVRR